MIKYNILIKLEFSLQISKTILKYKIYWNLNFLDRFPKNTKMQNINKAWIFSPDFKKMIKYNILIKLEFSLQISKTILKYKIYWNLNFLPRFPKNNEI